ncbi:MAG: HetP family heterocyst commitment protein [Sphaerospermopsis sp. SIO1G1]|nr:HetP family heterocyst commitment protein [Sphaerospermopsis sp. SIO1G1]
MINKNSDQKIQVKQSLKYAHWQDIIKAIINGKYAWACILFLHFSGYDPLEYIPYPTYKKLVKENTQFYQEYPNHDDERSGKSSIVRIY